jgi:hypothetical protein
VSEGDTPHLDYHRPSRERRSNPYITPLLWAVVVIGFALMCLAAAGIESFQIRYFD